MNVDAIARNAPAQKSAVDDAQKGASLNYDNFLHLLVAQLQHQDPTQPMDASEQMSQLASFSQVEQQIQSNAKLESLLSMSSLQLAQSYIGKYVSSPDEDGPKGIVASVKVYTDGVIATLEDGKQLLMGPGVSVAAKPPEKS
ncbi:flagellar hook assembly protein FlgD [Rhizobium sp. S152]|uniref:flagellar hook assembly protein FlgD n=1 Tax=Rhizobium sp. S152 TaxID=3055038 RepID=UPI0025AA0410|nr:flagellar hook assembly protein FlgD [Rhizobium sp. S152]MDM9628482.1 flagellar hook assembly protein FlgD [Rhizobium sp. S152]